MLLIAAMSYNFARFGVIPSIAAPASSYLRILNWSTLPLLLYGGIRRYLQGVGQVRVITVTYVLANLLNWGGNWVLIYGKLGFPALGVDGSAISTCIARVCDGCGAARYLPGATNASAAIRCFVIGLPRKWNVCACWYVLAHRLPARFYSK